MSFLVSVLHNKHCGSFFNGVLAILEVPFASPRVFGLILCETWKTKPQALVCSKKPVLPKPFLLSIWNSYLQSFLTIVIAQTHNTMREMYPFAAIAISILIFFCLSY